ncbi:MULTISPECIES: GNAT family N-acetyltransferase [Niastella]|uniref:BioF2-like acetyltransferase domain-containing protein n=1 Tax=Niastella soli TaxID=2821487 RepID=A0ABS3YU33_9BACT|nr:GNAT family N-acetyltransferase [Niastella soli]MBO9201378.1 hypothetical protein [Niastella soli]
MLPGNLQYLRRKQVDTVKWDQCIDKAPNGLIYACSFYLDHLVPNWDALVLGDYEAVMPLPWRKKFGVRYLYHPAFTQQLGVFSQTGLNDGLVAMFMDRLSAHFPYAEMLLNYAHPAKGMSQRSNYVLSLQEPYEQIRARYKNDLVKNLKRANRFPLSYSDEVDQQLVLETYKEFYGSRTPHVRGEDYTRFEKLCTFLSKGSTVVRAVKEEGRLLSAILLLRHNNRMYLLASVTWPAGRSREANHFLLDRVLHEFAGINLVLDFEGSDLPGVAHFYKNFGGIDQPYFFYRYNKLPWWIRWMK